MYGYNVLNVLNKENARRIDTNYTFTILDHVIYNKNFGGYSWAMQNTILNNNKEKR